MLKQMLDQTVKQTASKTQAESETDTDARIRGSRVVVAESQIQSDVTYRASAFGLGISA